MADTRPVIKHSHFDCCTSPAFPSASLKNRDLGSDSAPTTNAEPSSTLLLEGGGNGTDAAEIRFECLNCSGSESLDCPDPFRTDYNKEFSFSSEEGDLFSRAFARWKYLTDGGRQDVKNSAVAAANTPPAKRENEHTSVPSSATNIVNLPHLKERNCPNAPRHLGGLTWRGKNFGSLSMILRI